MKSSDLLALGALVVILAGLLFTAMHSTPRAHGAEPLKTVLLVTWIVGGSPPSSYQVDFNSLETCQFAMQAIQADRLRMVVGEAATAMPGGYYPVVSAVCAVR
jgi:hypothetical protein